MNGQFDIREYKKNLRKRYKALRGGLAPEVKAEKDRRILRAVRRLREYRRCHTLLCYVSIPGEIDTHPIIRTALEDGKAVAVPRCIAGTRLMDFHLITSMEQLSPGTFGVLEPDPAVCPKLTDFSHSLCILPGLSFDQYGYRLGYGGGYYDRFLSGTYLPAGGVTAGVCYEDCTRPFLIHGRYDVSCRYLVTEKGWRRTGNPPVQKGERGKRTKRKSPRNGALS